MLQLSRVRLVNWHFFEDTTIPIGATTLLAGDNGTGKSTIIDAIQYALVAQVTRIRFNSAATDRRTARTLAGYCRCKIGTDAVAFVRGDCITHVILEFHDLDRLFCAGIMVEAFVEGESHERCWVLDKGCVDDVEIFDEGSFVAPQDFRDQIKRLGGYVCATKREYNNRLTHLLGVYRRAADFNPYLAAVVRSVSFTPFTSVNNFVCDYILEERNVDVDAMKENLENYRLAEQESIGVEKRIEQLGQVIEHSDEVIQTNRQILRQEYLRIRLELERAEETVAKTKRDNAAATHELSLAEERYHSEIERKQRLEAERQEFIFALAKNDSHQLYERLRRDREETGRALEHERSRAQRRSTLIGQCETLLGRSLDPDLAVEEELLSDSVKSAVRRVVEIESEDRSLREELSELTSELVDLEAGMLRYPRSTTDLQSALRAAGIEATVFADLLEVADPAWQNAVEGWLGTRRFNLLVSDTEYQKALEIYDKQPAKIAGVGLPNLVKIRDTDAQPGSIAEIVEAATPQARRYIAYLLGKVVRAGIENLKSFDRAITRECMAYSSFTARRISPEVYSRWYIGKAARERRMTDLKDRIAEIVRMRNHLAEELGEVSNRANLERRVLRSLPQIVELSDAASRADDLAHSLEEIEQRITEFDTSSFDSLNAQITTLAVSIAAIDESILALGRSMGELTERIRKLAIDEEQQRRDVDGRKIRFDAFADDHSTELVDLEEYYNSRVKNERSAGRFSFDDFLRRYDSAFQGLNTRRNRSRASLTQAKQRYNHDFATLYELESDEAGEYREQHRRYVETELPSYRDRIARARSEAERQFRDHFVAKLNEYLIEAEEAFKEINHILQEISFGHDQYRFSISKKSELRSLLSAIATAAEVRDFDGPLFEVLHGDEERESIKRLFDQILEHDAEDQIIRDLCDYRQYFTYDIRIRHLDQEDPNTHKPLESNLSRVLREKSGGETQTPYYVAIAASFFRFYKSTPDAIRLVLFDEAFNKMDDQRIGQTVDFFRKLSMQVITAVPTEKLESIAPYMDQTSLVMRRDRRAFVRSYEVTE
jgi:energy-coupling factor transporter ATP-binding protein EcfA2